MSRRFLALLPVFLALLIFGCGGGGHSSKPGGTGVTNGGATNGGDNGGATGGTPTLDIAWPAQTRAVQAPVLAAGVRIQLIPDRSGTPLVNVKYDRPAGTAAVTTTYTLPSVPAGAYSLGALFTAEASPEAVVAEAWVAVKVLASGEMQRADGTPLGTVVTQGKVTSVRIVSSPALAPGETKRPDVRIDLQYGANVFAAPPGLLRLTVTSGRGALRANDDNTVTGLAEGTATVVASAAGFTSGPTTFTVTSEPLIAARTLSIGTGITFVYPLYEDPTRGHLWAILGGAAIEIDPASGTILRRVPSLGEITSFSLSDDGTAFYTTTKYSYKTDEYQLVRHDAATGAVVSAVNFGTTPVGGVAIQPGRNDVAAVALPATSPGESPRVAILDGTAPRPNTTTPGLPVWLSETRLAIVNSGIQTATVDAQGATLDGASNPNFAYVSGMTVADGRIYAGDAVYDATTLALIGRFTMPQDSYFTSPPVIANGLAFFVMSKESSSDLSSEFRIASYRVSDRSLVGVYRIAGFPPGPSTSQLRRWGAHGLAFNHYTELCLLDDVPGL